MFLIQSLLYFQRSPVTRHRRVTYVIYITLHPSLATWVWVACATRKGETLPKSVTTSQYIFNKRPKFTFASQNIFLQSVIYSTKRTIILAWGKSRVFSTDPPFLHRRDNNDCRPLHGTWRTLCMNKHLINKAVGRTQKTSFPLSSISKASLCSDFKQIPVLARANPRNQHPSFHSESFRNLFITRGTEYREWLVENITWQLASKFSQWELTMAARSG